MVLCVSDDSSPGGAAGGAGRGRGTAARTGGSAHRLVGEEVGGAIGSLFVKVNFSEL